MKWYNFKKKQPIIGEKIFTIKQGWTDCKIFISTYLGRKDINSIVCEIKLDNFQPYLDDKKYMPEILLFSSLDTFWARLN